MLIFIPTLGRIDKQPTWDAIPRNWKEKTFLICPKEDGKKHKSRGRNLLVHPNSCRRIGDVRQWIVENTSDPKILMIDDDHKFYRRVNINSAELVEASEKNIDFLFNVIETGLDRFAHIGVSARQGNNNLKLPMEKNYRYNNMYGFDVEVLKKENIRFDAIPLMEDFFVNLSLLTKGYQNRVISTFCWNQVGGSNAPGGCSTYRNAELQTRAAYALQKAFPEFVTIRKVKSQTMWAGMAIRDDVRIKWKKAYESSMKTSLI